MSIVQSPAGKFALVTDLYDTTQVGIDCVEINPSASDVDIAAAYGVLPRMLLAKTAGTLVVQTPGVDSSKPTRTLTMTADVAVPLAITNIVASGTTVTKLQMIF